MAVQQPGTPAHDSEGEVRDVPFLKNDMKESAPTTGWSVDTPDAHGKADSEIADEENAGATS
jgi:hypothetical protein